MARRRFGVDDKLQAVLAMFNREVSHREISKRHQLAPNQLYLWRKQFLEGRRQALAAGGSSSGARLRELERENDELKRMLAEELLAVRFLKTAIGAKG